MYEIEFNFSTGLYEILTKTGRCVKSSKSWLELDSYVKNKLGGYGNEA